MATVVTATLRLLLTRLNYLGDAGFTSLLKKGDRMEGTDAPKGPLACVVGPYYFGVAGLITS